MCVVCWVLLLCCCVNLGGSDCLFVWCLFDSAFFVFFFIGCMCWFACDLFCFFLIAFVCGIVLFCVVFVVCCGLFVVVCVFLFVV